MPQFSTDAALEAFLTQLQQMPLDRRVAHIMAMSKPELERELFSAIRELLTPTIRRP